jgi:hypothetical protein
MLPKRDCRINYWAKGNVRSRRSGGMAGRGAGTGLCCCQVGTGFAHARANTAPRVHAANAHMYRKLELNNDCLSRCRAVLERTLANNRYLSQSELATHLSKNGIEQSGRGSPISLCMPSLKHSFAAVPGGASSLPTRFWTSVRQGRSSWAAMKPWLSGRRGILRVTDPLS